MSGENWAQRTATLRAILREGGTVYRSQLTRDQDSVVPGLLEDNCLKASGGKLTITKTGREVAKSTKGRP